MTSREHARRLMLILLSSPGATDRAARTPDDSEGERSDDRQAGEGRDDSTEGDERATGGRLEALISM